MEPRLVIVMHEPLASAFAACVSHVLAGPPTQLSALDIPADLPPADGEARIRPLLDGPGPVLVLSDLAGATPYNMAWRAVQAARQQGADAALLAGVNVCAVLKALTIGRQPSDGSVTAHDWAAAVHAAGARGMVDADTLAACGCG